MLNEYVEVFEDLYAILPQFEWHQVDGSFVLKRHEKYFTPLTALCYINEGKYYPSLEYAYAASEINLDQKVATQIEKQNDWAEGPFYDELRKVFA